MKSDLSKKKKGVDEGRGGLRRCYHDIICIMLVKARKGILKTPLMYRAEVSYTQLEKYLQVAKKKGLIEERGRLLFTTSRGFRFIKEYQNLQPLRIEEEK